MSDKISILPSETILSIQMSGDFYKRLQALLQHLVSDMEIEDIMKVYQAAIEDKVTNQLEFHVQTMLYLCKEVEDTCTKNNLWKEVDPDSIKGDTQTVSKDE